MHEQSETDQDKKGRWVNTYGKNTDFPGRPLPPVYRSERKDYPTVESAVDQAKVRSDREGRTNDYKGMSDTLRSDYPSNLPSGGSLSPKGDLGALRSRETMKVFAHPIKGTQAPKSSSSYF